MEITGQLLKQRRENLKISVAEVSIATKITPRMVQAIEAGDMEKLPARTFLRGFVKSYASFLKMDMDAVLKSFAEEMAALEPPPPDPTEDGGSSKASRNQMPSIIVPDPPTSRASRGDSRSSADLISDGLSVTKKTSLAFGLAALIAITIFVYKMVDKYEREGRTEAPPELAKLTTSEAETESSGAKAPAAMAETAKETEKTVEPKPETAPAEVKQHEPVKVAETPKTPETVKPAEVAKPAESAKPVEAIKPADPVKKTEVPKAEPAKPAEVAKPAESVKPAAKPSANQEIIVEALDRVDLAFRVNGGNETRVTLQPDQVHTIKAVGSVSIDLSDGGAVNLIQNGRDLGVPGDLGRPKKLQLP